MLIKGEILQGAYTLGFTDSGERGDWTVRVIAPGGVVTEDQSCERIWYSLFAEMVAAALDAARRKRFPEREGAA